MSRALIHLARRTSPSFSPPDTLTERHLSFYSGMGRRVESANSTGDTMSAPSQSRHPGPSRWTGNRSRIGLLLVIGGGLPLLLGCPTGDSRRTDSIAGKLPEGVALSLVVVDDPPLATAIERLAGEWNALTGSDLRVSRMSQAELAATETLDADAVICPSCQVGEVASQAEIVPLPKHLLDDGEGIWPGIFSLLRVREAVWGQEVVGVPFGSPVFLYSSGVPPSSLAQ